MAISSNPVVPPPATVAQLSDIRQMVHRRLGWPPALASHGDDRVAELVAAGMTDAGIASPIAYLAELQRADSPLWGWIYANWTVGESYFFRTDKHTAWLKDCWLPSLIAATWQSEQPRIRVWSVGCADGQELYSIAMLIADVLPESERGGISLLGTDISEQSLAAARLGCYRSLSLRRVSAETTGLYFERSERGWQLSPEIKALATFEQANFGGQHAWCHKNQFDLILCRNLAIYLAPEAIRSMLSCFSSTLADSGLLLFGDSDLAHVRSPESRSELEGNFDFRRCGMGLRVELGMRRLTVGEGESGDQVDNTAGPLARTEQFNRVANPFACTVDGLLAAGRPEAAVAAIHWRTMEEGLTARRTRQMAQARFNQRSFVEAGDLVDDAMRQACEAGVPDPYCDILKARLELGRGDFELAFDSLAGEGHGRGLVEADALFIEIAVAAGRGSECAGRIDRLQARLDTSGWNGPSLAFERITVRGYAEGVIRSWRAVEAAG